MTNSPESWGWVPGYEGIYQASPAGEIRSVDRVVEYSNGHSQRVRGRVLSQSTDKSGHKRVRLYSSNKGQTRLVHSLVMETFIGPRPEEKEVCHNDGKPDNNRLENLRYDTRSENRLDTVRHGTHHQSKKEKCVRGHLLVAPNLKGNLAEKSQRGCRACNIAQSRCWHKKSKYGIILDVKEESDSAYKKIMEGTNNDK